MADYKKYRITADPRMRSVTPGAQVTYRCWQNYDTIGMEGAPQDKAQWYCYNDPAAAKARKTPHIVEGPKSFRWKDATWEFPGQHTIKCRVDFTDGMICYYDYPQWVVDVDFELARAVFQSRQKPLPDPGVAMSAAERYVQLLKRIEKKNPITDSSKKKEHDELVKGYENYRDKLADRLTSTGGCWRIPVHAIHLEKTTQRQSRLNVFLSWMGTEGGEQTWCLVDWTNPTDRSRTVEAEGKGATAEAAIRDAFKDWDSRNRYPDGWIKWEIPAKVCGKAFAGSFETDGSSFWDSVASFFEWIAIGAAVIAGIVTLIAPVPGSRIISAAIWTCIFSSTAAAVINIGQRHAEGFGSWKEDAFDALTIAGNIFAGAGAWAKGATVVAKTARGKIVKYALIGQVGTDAIQGIMIGVDYIAEYDKIMSDPSLTPDDRAKKLLELLRSASVAGLMTYISVKGSKADLENLNKSPKHLKAPEDIKTPADKLKELKDPTKTVDLTETPKTEGHTKNGKQKTTVQDEPLRAQPDTPSKPKRTFKGALAAAKRGMFKLHDAAFSRLAAKEKVIIIVRNSNEDASKFIAKKGYKPKPEDVKAKTLRADSAANPENVGLAAANPQNSDVKKMLADWEDPKTGKKGISYEEYVDLMGKKGYKIGDPPDYLVMDKVTGTKYYSDYDLHGVYKEGGADAYSESFRRKLNGRMYEEMVQHGPQDQWPKRLDPGPNQGPKPACTAYLPDGTKVHLETIEDMKAFYKEHGISWENVWNGRF